MSKVDLKTVHSEKYPPMKECPFCGCDEFYIKEYAKGYIHYRFRFDGEQAYNGDMYGGLDIRSASKFAYCSDCNRKLFRIEE